MRTRDAYANLALPAILRRHRLRDRDAGLATELGYGTLRARGLLDAVIEDVHRPAAEPGGARAAGRAAAGCLPAAAHPDPGARRGGHHRRAGARRGRAAGPAGFVNAILRKVGERDEPALGGAAGPGGRRGPGRARRVRARPPALDRPGLRRRAGPGSDRTSWTPRWPPTTPARRCTCSPAPARSPRPSWRWSPAAPRRPTRPYGVHLEPGSGDIGELDAIREGLAVVQDEGSQLVALALSRAAAGRRATAAAGWTCAPVPGGKAVLLGGLAALDGGAAGRGRDQRAPGRPGAPRHRRAAGHRAHRRRARRPAARRRLRPGAGRRPVHRAGRAAAPARGPLAAAARTTCPG